jgi:pyrrolysine biosynthesis protein PylC
MRVVIVGGKLQGIEASYLAHKAGWEVILVDRNSMVPAAGLCDAFYQLDVTSEALDLAKAIKAADLVIPALEEPLALEYLSERTGREGVPLAYDAAAYAISSSKRESALLFAQLGIQIPTPWPKCVLPVVVKPYNSSGSKGVRRINKMEELTAFVTKELDNWVIQEFLSGPSYSLEVIGVKGNFVSLQSTEIVVDSQYDCKRVLAPAGLSSTMNKKFKEIAITVADALNLNGIMDVEVISHKSTLKVLEIDARLPSQTPTVVNKSTGINMLELLYDVFVKGAIPTIPDVKYEKGVVYEHIKVSPGILEVAGEHIMANARPLKFYEHFFGADEALTDFVPGHLPWVATLIITGDSCEEAWNRRCLVIEDIRNYFGLSVYSDSIPNCSEVPSAKKVEGCVYPVNF